MTARTPKYQTRRARVHCKEYGGTLLSDLFNCPSFTISAEEQTVKLESASEVKGTLAVETLSQTFTANLQLNSMDFENFVRFTRSKATEVAPVTNGTVTAPIGDVGEGFKLPATNINTFSMPGKEAGVDYKIFKTSGIVVYLTPFTATIPGCPYSSGAVMKAAVNAGGEKTFTLYVTNTKAGETVEIYKFRPSLPTNIQLVTPNEFGLFEVTGELLIDENRAEDGDDGQYFKVEYGMTAA